MSLLFDLTGRVAVVVGGTSGIGRTIAIGLAEAGADVVATARRQELVDEVANEIEARGRRSLRVASDVGDRESLERVHAETMRAFGRVDIVVCAAGITKRVPTLDMEEADWHIFQVLTKRSSLMRSYLRVRYGKRTPPGHIWLGVSVEHGGSKARIEHLRTSPAAVRFLSVEPLIGPIGQVDLSGIHWVIAGGESGPGARPMHIDWAREIRDRCAEQNIAFFFKQWGGIRPKSGGRNLDGREWNELPTTLGSCAA